MNRKETHKIQVSISDESIQIFKKLSQKNTKGLFVDLAIKNFAKTKEAKLFLKDEKENSIYIFNSVFGSVC